VLMRAPSPIEAAAAGSGDVDRVGRRC